MEKVMLAFEYEPLVLSLKLKTSNEEEDKGNNDGVGPLKIRTIEEEGIALKGRLVIRHMYHNRLWNQ